ncbi:hypothetical protein LCM14_06175 [Priestia aryabhattai]|uniref:hypothetical protein n=1 Tax=Priestia aryabhattai TaxID=412384 RepID=UPI001CD5C164|nr:hypothetical protein [Priestia aryabhattai]MCA1049378.1 hypothetical protein [Priestia aryabhattai]
MSMLELFTSSEILGLTILKTVWFRTLFTALLAAAFTQWLNNTLTKEREKEKKLKETFSTFYGNIIPEIYDFFNVQTDFRKGSSLKIGVVPEEIKERILDIIFQNMPYVNSEIHMAYRKVITNKYFDDQSGFSHDTDEINLFYTIVEEYIKLIEKHEVKEVSSDVKYACLLLIWKNVVENCGGYEMAYAAISEHRNFDITKLNKENLEKIKQLDAFSDDERNSKFRDILEGLIAHNDMDDKNKKEFLKKFFTYNFEENDSAAISKLNNLDLNPGEITIEFRVLYRQKLLSNLYKSKYDTSIIAQEDLLYTKQQFLNIHNELKNAVNYWEEKGMLKIKYEEDTVKLIITAIGEDYYEENIYPF